MTNDKPVRIRDEPLRGWGTNDKGMTNAQICKTPLTLALSPPRGEGREGPSRSMCHLEVILRSVPENLRSKTRFLQVGIAENAEGAEEEGGWFNVFCGLPKPATRVFPHKRRSLRESWCRLSVFVARWFFRGEWSELVVAGTCVDFGAK
jgi:hypothetical protein